MLYALCLVALAALPQSSSHQGLQTPAWIGVGLREDGQSDRPLCVTQVGEGSPANRAGLREGDRLLAFEGRPLQRYDDLLGLLREFGPGREVRLDVRRVVAIELDQRGQGESGHPRLGVRLGQESGTEGPAWIVRSVEAGWPAARAGLRAGDRLTALQGRKLESFDQLQELLSDVPAGRELRCTIERTLELRLGSKPEDSGQRPGNDGPISGSHRLSPDPGFTPTAESLERELASLRAELQSLRSELRSLLRELEGLRSRAR